MSVIRHLLESMDRILEADNPLGDNYKSVLDPSRYSASQARQLGLIGDKEWQERQGKEQAIIPIRPEEFVIGGPVKAGVGTASAITKGVQAAIKPRIIPKPGETAAQAIKRAQSELTKPKGPVGGPAKPGAEGPAVWRDPRTGTISSTPPGGISATPKSQTTTSPVKDTTAQDRAQVGRERKEIAAQQKQQSQQDTKKAAGKSAALHGALGAAAVAGTSDKGVVPATANNTTSAGGAGAPEQASKVPAGGDQTNSNTTVDLPTISAGPLPPNSPFFVVDKNNKIASPSTVAPTKTEVPVKTQAKPTQTTAPAPQSSAAGEPAPVVRPGNPSAEKIKDLPHVQLPSGEVVPKVEITGTSGTGGGGTGTGTVSGASPDIYKFLRKENPFVKEHRKVNKLVKEFKKFVDRGIK